MMIGKFYKSLAALAAVLILLSASLEAETMDSLEKVEEAALMNNLDYKSALLEVTKAENVREGRLKWDSSSVSVSTSYGQGNGSALGWQSSLNLPLLEQMSLGASVGDQQSALSVTLDPLAHSDVEAQTLLAYRQKVVAAEEMAREIVDRAVEAYLSWAVAASDYEVKKSAAAVKKSLYEDEKVRYEVGESDLDEVRLAFTAWSEAVKAMNTAQSTRESARLTLYTLLNLSPREYELALPDQADLLEKIESLKAGVAEAELSVAGRSPLLTAEITTQGLEKERENTWLLEPQLLISGALTFSAASPQPVPTASASLSFSLDDWKADEIDELERELEISRQLQAQTLQSEQLNLQKARIQVENTSLNWEVARVEGEQARELLDEAEFLFSRGEYSQSERDEMLLQFKQSRNNLFSAAADHYIALRNLLLYRQ